MEGWQLRAERRAKGLTLRQVARAAGTSESNVAAYERGSRRPGTATRTRLCAVVAAGADSPIHRNRLLTSAAAAAALRAGIRGGWVTADLLRVVRELRSNAEFVTTERDRAAFLAVPSTTGDQRWDAMLAGCVEEICLRRGWPVPAWTRGKALPTFWFVGSAPSLAAYAFARSPFPMQVRGIMMDPADLEAV